MSDEIYWIYIVNVNEGAVEQFRELIGELIEATRKETDTISYQFSTNDDGRTIHIFELYRDSTAVVSHVKETFAPFADRFKALARTTSVTVYGKPDVAARELIDQWDAVYVTPFDGFLQRS